MTVYPTDPARALHDERRARRARLWARLVRVDWRGFAHTARAEARALVRNTNQRTPR